MRQSRNRMGDRTLGELTIRFWGVGGSMPAAAGQRRVFGSHTICLEIMAGGRRLIIDAGTGISNLGHLARPAAGEPVDILFTHCHWDHVFGLTGFQPVFESGRQLNLHFPAQPGRNPEAVLAALFRPPFFPLPLSTLPAVLSCREFATGNEIRHGEMTVRSVLLNHPDGATGYRIDGEAGSIAIITDHEHGVAAIDDSIATLCAGVDLLVYDAMWDEDVDYSPHRGWGHSTWQAGLELLRRCSGRRLVCIHHDPHADDDSLIAREAKLQAAHAASLFAREGLVLATR